MLSAIQHHQILTATEAVIDTLGVPADWEQAKAPYAKKCGFNIGFKTVGFKDEELINAFGIGAKVFTVKVSDIAVIEKFDRFTIGEEKYTIDAVMPVHLNGVQIFHKCFVKGK